MSRKALTLLGGKKYFTELYNPTLAYSFYKLNPDQVNCVRIKRSSDNSETTIGFDGDVVDESAISSFCGASNGSIVTWHNQGSASQHLETTGFVDTTATHPLIYDGSSVIKSDGNVSLKWDATTLQRISTTSYPFSGATEKTFYCAFNTTQSTTYIMADSENREGGSGWYFYADNGSGSAPHNLGSPSYYKNGVLISSPTRDKLFDNFNSAIPNLATIADVEFNPVDLDVLTLFSYATGWEFHGYVQELIAFDSTTIRNTDVENDIMNRLNI